MMVFNKILGRWQKLWWKKKKLMAKAQVSEKKKLQSGPLTMHFQHSGAKIRVFGQKTDITKFWFFNFYSVTGSQYPTT